MDKDSLHHKTITINIASGNEKFYSVGSMISLSSAHWTGEKSIDFKIPPRCSSDIRLATYPTHLLSHPLDSEPFIGRKPYDKGSPDPRLPLRNMRQQLLMTHVIIPFLAHHITSHPTFQPNFSTVRSCEIASPMHPASYHPPPLPPLSACSLSSFLFPSSTRPTDFAFPCTILPSGGSIVSPLRVSNRFAGQPNPSSEGQSAEMEPSWSVMWFDMSSAQTRRAAAEGSCNTWGLGRRQGTDFLLLNKERRGLLSVLRSISQMVMSSDVASLSAILA